LFPLKRKDIFAKNPNEFHDACCPYGRKPQQTRQSDRAVDEKNPQPPDAPPRQQEEQGHAGRRAEQRV
jgi:hypothetical protein